MLIMISRLGIANDKNTNCNEANYNQKTDSVIWPTRDDFSSNNAN